MESVGRDDAILSLGTTAVVQLHICHASIVHSHCQPGGLQSTTAPWLELETRCTLSLSKWRNMPAESSTTQWVSMEKETAQAQSLDSW